MVYVIYQIINLNDTKTQNIRMAKGIVLTIKILN